MWVQQRGRLARVTQNSHQSLEFRKWAKGCSFTVALSDTLRTKLCTYYVYMIWILYSDPIMSIDEHKQTVDIKIEFLLLLLVLLVDVILYSTHTLFFILFFFFVSTSSASSSLSLRIHIILCNKKHTRLKFHIFNITTIRTSLFDLRLIIAQTLFTHRFSWWEWNLSESKLAS